MPAIFDTHTCDIIIIFLILTQHHIRSLLKKPWQAAGAIVFVWKGIHSRSGTNRTGASSLSFYYLRLLYCPDQMLAEILLSQHRVSSSKTVRLCAPCGARYMGHTIRTWSAVCLEASHSQFGEGARPQLCMDKRNLPTPVRRQLSLT